MGCRTANAARTAAVLCRQSRIPVTNHPYYPHLYSIRRAGASLDRASIRSALGPTKVLPRRPRLVCGARLAENFHEVLLVPEKQPRWTDGATWPPATGPPRPGPRP